jgi:hypothetical protein
LIGTFLYAASQVIVEITFEETYNLSTNCVN